MNCYAKEKKSAEREKNDVAADDTKQGMNWSLGGKKRKIHATYIY